MRRRYIGGKSLLYTDNIWELGQWTFTSTTTRWTTASNYTQPVYTDGTRGVKTLIGEYVQEDIAYYYGTRPDIYYEDPQYYSNPYTGGRRVSYIYTVYQWSYDGSFTEEYTDYVIEYATITFDYPSYWSYAGYVAFNLSTTTPPYGWRNCYTNVYCTYSDYTQIIYNHLYREYQSSYLLVNEGNGKHHYIITFTSGETYVTPSF